MDGNKQGGTWVLKKLSSLHGTERIEIYISLSSSLCVRREQISFLFIPCSVLHLFESPLYTVTYRLSPFAIVLFWH